MILTDEFRSKLRRRAKRAFNGKTTHRITGITKQGLIYRLASGERINIRRDVLGRIYIPRSLDLA